MNKKVKDTLIAFLEEKKMRKTPERFQVLKEIYDLDEHFDAEFLFTHLKKKNMEISRATVYNVLELLVDAKLVRKNQFGKSNFMYEKSFYYKQHDHLICLDCGKVLEFCDARIQSIQSTMGNIFDFDVSNHALFLYGHCKKKKEGSKKCQRV